MPGRLVRVLGAETSALPAARQSPATRDCGNPSGSLKYDPFPVFFVRLP